MPIPAAYDNGVRPVESGEFTLAPFSSKSSHLFRDSKCLFPAAYDNGVRPVESGESTLVRFPRKSLNVSPGEKVPAAYDNGVRPVESGEFTLAPFSSKSSHISGRGSRRFPAAYDNLWCSASRVG